MYCDEQNAVAFTLVVFSGSAAHENGKRLYSQLAAGNTINLTSGNDTTITGANAQTSAHESFEGTSGTLDFTSRDKDREQITRATIGEGTINVRDNPDQDLSDLNRDIDTAQEILKDKDETTDVYASTTSVGSLKGLKESGEDNTLKQWACNIGSIADPDSYKAMADNAAQLGNADELKSGWEQAKKTLGVTGELPPELDAKNQQLRDQIVRELTEQNDGEVPDNLQLYLDQNGDIAAAEVDGVPVYMDADLEQQFAAELEERSQRQATELALAEESDAYIDALSGTLDDVWSNTDDQYYTALGASNQRFDELTAPELGSASEREHLAAYPEWREPLIADHDAWVDSVTTSGRQAAEFPLVAAETAGTLGWNAYTMSVAGVGGLAVTPFKGREAGAQTIDAFMANYGYTPRLEGTRHTFDAIGQVFAPIDEQLQNAGNATLDTTGSPFLATTVHISPDLVGTLFGGLPGSARATVRKGASDSSKTSSPITDPAYLLENRGRGDPNYLAPEASDAPIVSYSAEPGTRINMAVAEGQINPNTLQADKPGGFATKVI